MSIKNRLNIENISFLNEWNLKRNSGFRRYTIYGCARCLLFSAAILIGRALVITSHNISFEDIMVYFVISLLLPIMSWLINEYRYTKINDNK